MRQNFIADNIAKLSIPDSASGLLVHSAGPVGLNGRVSATFNSSFSAWQFEADISSDTLFSWDLAISGQSVGASADHCLVVFTYSASTPLDRVDVDVSSNFSSVFNPLVIGDRLTHSGRCIVPKLSLADGERQYVGIGFASDVPGAIACTSRFIQSRMHLEDIQVFDPLRN